MTADYISLNPEFNALLAPQLSSPNRINQLKEYVLLNNHFPTTIVIDMTRNEDNLNVENLYSTLENIKNGRLDSTFYGWFKRLRFKSPHLIIFTNNVSNMSALSSDRFNLLVLADKTYYFFDCFLFFLRAEQNLNYYDLVKNQFVNQSITL